jgi:peroxiredoxin
MLAPGFSLPSLGGGKLSLTDLLKDGPTAVVFFKISCPVCQFTLPYLERLSGGPVRFVAISQDDESATVRFNERFKITLPTLLDGAHEGYRVSNAYGITNVPTIFLIETDGSISQSFSGFSKKDMEALGVRAKRIPFRPEDKVPEWKAG